MRIASIIILLSISWMMGYGQEDLPPKAKKQFNASIELYNSGQRKKGIETARAVLNQYPYIIDVWDIMAEMYKTDLDICKEEFNRSMNKSLEDIFKEVNQGKKKSKKKSDKSELMGALGPYVTAQIALDNFLREATLKSRSTIASIYLRGSKVDVAKPDSLVGSEARKSFNKAENLFANGNYQEAIPFYRDAIAKANNGYYYNAELYLGDSYYMLHDYDSAKKYFTACSKSYPQYIESHKYLADCYAKMYEYENSIEACIQSFLIYPDNSMFVKLEDAVRLLRKKYNDGWIIRGCYPYARGDKQTNAPGPWADYLSSSQQAWAGADTIGVIKNPADFENEQYAEVYAWKKMLEKDNGKTPDLAFAREMQQKGYLDCYVFISLFHYDLYPAYKHFATNHPDKVGEYLRSVVAYK